MSVRGFGIYLACVVGLIAAASVASKMNPIPAPKPAPPRKNPCDELLPMTGTVMMSAVANRTVSDDSPADHIYVRTRRWQDAGNDARVSIALAAFCIRHMGGVGTVYVKSHETSGILATVKDGNYFD